MAGNSLSENEWATHYRRELIGDLSENIVKIHALTTVALGSNMKEIKHTTMFYYWDTLNDLVRAAKHLCEELSKQRRGDNHDEI